ncbi:DNA-binding transcriptional LysR family regulator [Neorhizobium huautlense]|uniref:DNA-binding transcriptional LysR family regulator n=1 Tax=Neorhizobium huautlense TaxID=67774 RepID=A0ABT9PM14_9HYPH|nr:LysR substrate-binding domain-containing protein [Neorhizobium huautlense]MDP9835495.1 DNA-binding transcriptional LysR family regulator [Neorhizobium huautlense]
MAAPKTPRATQFELRHLRYFIALVEERNFERAAARLGIAQPGLSQQIRNLETLVGLPLLDRSKRSVHLTPPGQILFDEARKIVAQTDAALSQLRRVGRGQTGKISIGYVASVAYSGVLTQSLSSFRQTYPDIELQLVEMEMRMQLNKIAEGELDFGYIRPPVSVPAGVATMTVLREPLVVALPANHPLASVEEVHLAALSAESFITPRQPADVGWHSNTLEACRAAGFEPAISATGRDFTTIASMVAVGLGAAVGPQSLSCLRLPGVRYLRLLNNRVTSDLAVAYRKTEGSVAVRAFIAHQRAKYAQATLEG